MSRRYRRDAPRDYSRERPGITHQRRYARRSGSARTSRRYRTLTKKRRTPSSTSAGENHVVAVKAKIAAAKSPLISRYFLSRRSLFSDDFHCYPIQRYQGWPDETLPLFQTNMPRLSKISDADTLPTAFAASRHSHATLSTSFSKTAAARLYALRLRSLIAADRLLPTVFSGDTIFIIIAKTVPCCHALMLAKSRHALRPSVKCWRLLSS